MTASKPDLASNRLPTQGISGSRQSVGQSKSLEEQRRLREIRKNGVEIDWDAVIERFKRDMRRRYGHR